MCNCDGKFTGIILCGLGFLFIFRSYELSDAIEATYSSLHGPISTIIIYVIFALSNFLAPILTRAVGSRLCMIIGSLFYLFFAFFTYWRIGIVIYIFNIILGIGFSFLWVGGSTFILNNSEKHEISVNSAIFWTLLHIDPIGNSFGLLISSNVNDWSNSIHAIIFAELGLFAFLFLQCPLKKSVDRESFQLYCKDVCVCGDFLKKSKLGFMSFLFFYAGLSLTFSNVHQTSLSYITGGHLEFLDLTKFYFGVGNIFAGIFIAGCAYKTLDETKIIAIGAATHLFTYIFVFFNIPARAHLNDMEVAACWHKLAHLCSIGLGIGNACINTQIYVLIYKFYPDKIPEAVSIYKLAQLSGMLFLMLLAAYFRLSILILVCLLFLIAAFCTFFHVMQLYTREKCPAVASRETVDASV